MAVVLCSQLVASLLFITHCITGQHDEHRNRRQNPAGTYQNPGGFQPKVDMPMQMGNNPPFMPANNQNMMPTNERASPKPMLNNEQLLAASQQQQMGPMRSQGFYNSPSFQPPVFSGQQPTGWFGTNHLNWVSSKDSELDKNKMAAAKNPPLNNAPANAPPPNRDDGGPLLLAKIAKQYASKGDKAFTFGPMETLQGRGSVCSNHNNFEGFVYGSFPCPLPASTGMNQQDQFCCGPGNYQHCCNAQEFSQTQRGAFGDNRFIGDQRYPRPSTYPSSTKKILAIVLPIVGVLVLSGIGALVFLFYRRFRKEQYRTGKAAGAIRLQDSYSVLPQDLPMEKPLFQHQQAVSQA